MLGVLRHVRFRRLFTAQVVALVGTGLLTVALGLLAYDLAGGAAGSVLGTALAVKMVAYVFVAPVVSAAAERVPRRLLLVSADAVRAGTALMLPWVHHVWQIYVLIFVLQSASATFTPAFQAVIASVLPAERDYTRGLSLSRAAYDLESLLSPALAAALLTVLDYNLLFVGTAAGFVASVTMVVGTPLPRPAPADRSTPIATRITRGARIMLDRPALRALLAMNLAVAAATALVIVNTVVFVRELLSGTAATVAVALGCFGGGSMLVALSTPRLLAAGSDRRLMLAGCALLPAGLLVAALLAATRPAPEWGWPLLAASWAVLGAGASMINTPAARLLRAHSDSDTRTAVFTAQFSLSHGCFLLTYPAAGWVGGSAGQFGAALAMAAVATLAATAAAWMWPTATPPGRRADSDRKVVMSR